MSAFKNRLLAKLEPLVNNLKKDTVNFNFVELIRNKLESSTHALFIALEQGNISLNGFNANNQQSANMLKQAYLALLSNFTHDEIKLFVADLKEALDTTFHLMAPMPTIVSKSADITKPTTFGELAADMVFDKVTQIVYEVNRKDNLVELSPVSTSGSIHNIAYSALLSHDTSDGSYSVVDINNVEFNLLAYRLMVN